MFTKFLMHRAEQFSILRKTAIEGYDLSFLITVQHLGNMDKKKLVEFITLLVQDIDKEISEMKLMLNFRARAATTAFLEELSK